MEMTLRPLTLDTNQLKGLSGKLINSHFDNNYTGAIKRLNTLRLQLSTLDWANTPVFTVNGLKREELIAANSAFLHELYFDVLGGDGVLPSCGLSSALERDFGSVAQWQTEFTSLAKAMGCCTVPIFMVPLLTWICVTLGFVFSPGYLLLLAIPVLLMFMRKLRNQTSRSNRATANDCGCSSTPRSIDCPVNCDIIVVTSD